MNDKDSDMAQLFWIVDGSLPPLDTNRGTSHNMILNLGYDIFTGFYDYFYKAWWCYELEDWLDVDDVEGWCDPTDYRDIR